LLNFKYMREVLSAKLRHTWRCNEEAPIQILEELRRPRGVFFCYHRCNTAAAFLWRSSWLYPEGTQGQSNHSVHGVYCPIWQCWRHSLYL